MRGVLGRISRVIGVAALSLSLTQGIAASTQAARGATSSQWQTSWVAFTDDVDAFRKKSKDFPSPSFQMLSGGQELPDTFSAKRRYDGMVTWEGKFKGLQTKDSKDALLMDGQTLKLDLEMPSVAQGWIVHAYPAAESVARWKAMAPNSAVRFSARFRGVAGFQPLKEMVEKDKVVYYLLLTDAQPVAK